MHKVHRYVLGAIMLLAVVVLFGTLFSHNLIGAVTVTGRTLVSSPGQSIAPTPALSAPPPQPMGGLGESVGNNAGTTQQTGAPAIRPTIPGAGPNSPAFTEADVLEYAKDPSRGFIKLGIDRGSPPPQVVKIEFATLSTLRKEIPGDWTYAIPDDSLLCYVEYSGAFGVSSPPTSDPSKVKVFHYTHASQIFDAHTGNVLGSSAW